MPWELLYQEIFVLGVQDWSNHETGTVNFFCDFFDKEIIFHFPTFPPFKGKIQIGQVNPGRHEFFEDTSFPSQTTLRVKAGYLAD